MKVSLAHHLHASRLRSGGAVASSSSSSASCRQFFAMEAVQPQHPDHHQNLQQQNLQQFQQHQPLPQNSSSSWWNSTSNGLINGLPSDSSIDSFHPDSSVFSSLNSDISLPSSTSASPSPLTAPFNDGGAFPGPSSPELTPQAEVNPTSFEILPSVHAQTDDQRVEHTDDADHVDSPGELSEIHGESSENGTAPDDASVNSNNCMPEAPLDRPSSSEGPPSRMRLMCSYGGRITPRLVDGKLRYTGGETRIVAVKRGISFDEFMKKMVRLYGSPLGFKYQLPDEDLDALVSVSCDDDLQNMVEEYEKAESSAAGSSRIRLFFYSSTSDLDISEETLKTDSEGALSPASDQQQFVHTVNGVSEKLQNTHMEEDNLAFKQMDAANVENSSRILPHDVPNVLTHSKSTSTLSSYPSSPQLVPRPVYTKIPDDLSLSHQVVNDHLYSKPAAVGLHRFAGDLEPDGLIGSPASSHFEHVYHHDPHHIDQIRVVSDSPRAPHHEFPTHRGDNWHGMQWVDSPPKHIHQPALNPMDTRMSSSAPAVDYWNDVQHPSDTLSHLEHHHRLVQQHGLQQHQQHQHLQHPTHQTHQQHHPQGRPVQIDLDRVDHRTKDLYKQQPHGFYQPHPPPQVHTPPQPHPASQHYGHHAVVTQDRGSWSTDHRALPSRFHPVSKTNPGPIPHGLAPAPPYHMDAAPSSPRAHVHDYHHGRCSCGLQHTEVHRGITVCIDDQPQSKWSSSHAGDQSSRKHGFSGQSRLYDPRNYFADSSMWQQPSHIIGPTETDHKDQARLYDGRNHFVTDSQMWQQSNHVIGANESEHREPIGKSWHHQQPPPPQPHHLHWRHAESHQSRSYMVQCHDRVVTDEVYVPTHDCHETCIGNNGNIKHIGNKGVVSHGYHDKPFEMEPGRFNVSRKAMYQNMIVKDDDYFIDDGSNHVQTPFTEGIPYPKKNDMLHVSTAKLLESEEMQVNQVLPTVVSRGSDYLQNFSTQNTQTEVMGHWGMSSIDREYLDVSFQHGQNLNGRVEGLNDVHVSRNTSRSNSPLRITDVTYNPNQSSVSHISQHASRSNSPLRVTDVEHIPNQANISRISKQASRSNSPLRMADVPKQNSIPTGKQTHNPNVSQQHGVEGSETMVVVNNGWSGEKMYAAGEDGYLVSPDAVMVNSPVNSAPVVHMQQEVSKAMIAQDSSVKVPLYDKVSVNAPLFDEGSANNVTDFSFSKAVVSNIVTQNQNDYGGLSSVSKPILNECNIDLVTVHVDNTMTMKEPVQAVTDQKGENENKNFRPNTEPLLEKCEDENNEAPESSSQLDHMPDIQSGKVISSNNDVQGKESEMESASQEKGSKNENILPETTVRSPLLQAEVLGLQIINNSDLEDLKELGSGTFGTVYHGKWRGSDVAIKRIKASCFAGPPAEQERLISDFWKEASTLGKLHHPNVVAFYGVVPDGPGGTLATVTEYMVNGSLKQVLQKKDRTIDRRKRLLIAMDAAFGMEYLHNKRIVHFDLKCENLLVNMKDAHRPICKVGDFGLSKVKHQTLITGGVRGTLPWMAPELLSGNSNKVTDKIDVYSFGIVMWELLTGEEPYANMHCGAIIRGIVDNTLRPSIPTWCDPGWRKLMEQCWSSDPTERPSFTEIALELRAIAASMNIK